MPLSPDHYRLETALDSGEGAKVIADNPAILEGLTTDRLAYAAVRLIGTEQFTAPPEALPAHPDFNFDRILALNHVADAAFMLQEYTMADESDNTNYPLGNRSIDPTFVQARQIELTAVAASQNNFTALRADKLVGVFGGQLPQSHPEVQAAA